MHGGGSRLPRIIEEISAYDPDVVAVTEYRATPGVVLCAAMKERGLPYCETTNPSGTRNGIAVFSRAPIRLKPCSAPPESQVRWLDIDLPEYGFSICTLHVMAAGSTVKSPCNVAKARFWNAVLVTAEARLHEPYLLIGDWNTGAHRLDEKGKTFVCAEHFAKLSARLDRHVADTIIPAPRNGPGIRNSKAARVGTASDWITLSRHRVSCRASLHAGTRTSTGTPEYPTTRW
jgi:exonuclease III